MKVLRNILSDLVEKRLWPLAVGLLVAAVAVPILIGRGSSDTPAPDVPAATTASTDRPLDSAVVALEESTGKVQRKGAVRDPFVQHHVPKPVEVTTTPAETTPSEERAAGGGAPTDEKPATRTTPAVTEQPAEDEEATERPTSTDTYRVNIDFGVIDATKPIEDVARLAPLPSADEPFFVFMGVGEDGESATFLIASDATPVQTESCRPSPESCETVTLKLDDTVFFDLAGEDGTTTQYELTLDKVVKGTAKTPAKARAARTRESAAGRTTLRRLKRLDPELLQGWSYAADRGVLVAHAVPEGAEVSAPKAAGLSASGSR